MTAKECPSYANHHCITDCPNIQVDMCDDKWGYGVADDIGLHRVRCKDCDYVRIIDCDACMFQGSILCPDLQNDDSEKCGG